ncbi:unnamed protein product [Bemisia tabaci]|uniref:Arrestin C-terminal-like domain-containing protein n=1 Tax=Bemisia tabaci TaxID=7038 RepID=A0A9P0AIE0_BEMTA|nr:unnamed protein product [Bemisia tabaci]
MALLISKSVDFVQGIYFPDEPVTGHIKFNLREKTNVSNITVNIVGERAIFKSCSTDRSSNSKEEREANQDGKAVKALKLIDLKECIFSGSQGQFMDAGSHSVPFSVRLPGSIPSSVESPQWAVHYKLVATVMGASDLLETFERSFCVNRICDLNIHPKAKMPIAASVTASKCPCISWDMVTASLQLDRQGFIPGEQICVNACIENHSHRPIYYTKVSLVQKMCHVDVFADSRKLKCKRLVTDYQRGSIPVGTTQVWMNEMITVPPVPSSSIHDCYGWSIQYWIQMDVVNVAPKIVATMRIPVFIGNIPLKSLYPHLKMPSPGSLNMDFFQANWEFFSEEECTFSDKTGDEIASVTTPKYLVLHPVSNGDCKEIQSLPANDGSPKA